MELIIERSEALFDSSAIAPGDAIYAKHYSWNDGGRCGFVTSVTDKQITVQFHPGIGNVTNHFFIPVSEAVNGDWEIRWSKDLVTVYEYQPNTEAEEVDDGL